ncbi:hypothetical protein BpHYR1_005940 [Brachionus plicatilis]|uniref:Uncharacterized protein n=1 Tax=Brachionus plicatilis TaxID=10195 RepID=A0A3M7SRA9_BRAPC|nr:hypothetical protein BpHYR1_005940 [Brachionus plicatilis]
MVDAAFSSISIGCSFKSSTLRRLYVKHSSATTKYTIDNARKIIRLSKSKVCWDRTESYIPFVIKLVKEYKEGFQSRYIEYPNPLCSLMKTYFISESEIKKNGVNGVLEDSTSTIYSNVKTWRVSRYVEFEFEAENRFELAESYFFNRI